MDAASVDVRGVYSLVDAKFSVSIQLWSGAFQMPRDISNRDILWSFDARLLIGLLIFQRSTMTGPNMTVTFNVMSLSNQPVPLGEFYAEFYVELSSMVTLAGHKQYLWVAHLLDVAAVARGKTVDKGTPGDSIDTKPMSNLGKRKRYMTDEDVAVFNGMKEAVSDVAAAVRESIHAEAAPRIYNAVINCPGFSREALMYALNHMMEHKATSLVFLDMTPDDRDLWLRTFLAKHYHN
uniref:Uncharacterized protein n=1 Tax=Zea mays TaxID=4577 RepID=A0A804PNM8_MAIZE